MLDQKLLIGPILYSSPFTGTNTLYLSERNVLCLIDFLPYLSGLHSQTVNGRQ